MFGRKGVIAAVAAAMCTAAVLTAGSTGAAASGLPLPSSMAALGDSISRGYDACCSYGDHLANSWTTGNASNDGITSHYEHILALNPAISGHAYNDAVTGAKASGLATQASQAVSQGAQYVTVLIGANDLCTSSVSTMTPTSTFTSQVTSAFATLAQGLPNAHIFVSSIPNIYQLWNTLHTNFSARFVWSLAGICQSMLASSNTETQRQQVVSRETAFNTTLASVCAQYPNCTWDNLTTYNVQFAASDVSTLDYFHPSLSGQAKLATATWAVSGY